MRILLIELTLVYALGCQMALTVFAARMSLGYEEHDVSFASMEAFQDSVLAYFGRMLHFMLAWPLNLYRWLADDR